MDMLEKAGLATMVGKVNMDRNSPDYLREETEESVNETISWLEEVQKKQYQHTRPILTPRFIPSCTDELMHKLKDIQVKYQIPVQSHLSENYGEIAWVQELCPNQNFMEMHMISLGCLEETARRLWLIAYIQMK